MIVATILRRYESTVRTARKLYVQYSEHFDRLSVQISQSVHMIEGTFVRTFERTFESMSASNFWSDQNAHTICVPVHIPHGHFGSEQELNLPSPPWTAMPTN